MARYTFDCSVGFAHFARFIIEPNKQRENRREARHPANSLPPRLAARAHLQLAVWRSPIAIAPEPWHSAKFANTKRALIFWFASCLSNVLCVRLLKISRTTFGFRYFGLCSASAKNWLNSPLRFSLFKKHRKRISSVCLKTPTFGKLFCVVPHLLTVCALLLYALLQQFLLYALLQQQRHSRQACNVSKFALYICCFVCFLFTSRFFECSIMPKDIQVSYIRANCLVLIFFVSFTASTPNPRRTRLKANWNQTPFWCCVCMQ
jgi:hypothetical protein